MRDGLAGLRPSIVGVLATLAAISCGPGNPTAIEAVRYCQGGRAYIDADGDGYGKKGDPGIACDNGIVPEGYSSTTGDCDDTNPAAFRNYIKDADGDGYPARDDFMCGGDEPPPGTPVEPHPADCDDTDPNLNTWYYLDADGDGRAISEELTICGPKEGAPPNATAWISRPGDCDDNNPAVSSLYYLDADGDGWAATNQLSICGDPREAPAGYGRYLPLWHDCDDTRPDVSPDGFELWDDNIDSDCNGALAPALCPAEICGTVTTTVPTDATCSTFDLAVTAVYSDPQCTGITWYATIANHGNALASDHALNVDAGDRSFALPPLDPISPGRAYTYRLPDEWDLSGAVRFTVATSSPDCRSDNDVLEAMESPWYCGI